jgi:hypothetical protein
MKAPHRQGRVSNSPAGPFVPEAGNACRLSEQDQAGIATEAAVDSGSDSGACEAVVSSCGDQGRVLETARPWRLQCGDCEELLQELSHLITGVLTNAQLLAWKLPPYSHLKRSVREMERSAQRSSELLKRLTRRLGPEQKAEAPNSTARS